mgnify:FL=1|tara:strand:- start:418 stop:1089 length:672 start_codon:yes stop_codon:yes gene_type:complete
MKKKHIIGVILARKGSKRLKNKNLRKFYKDKNLINSTIIFSKKLKFLKKTILSSDDLRIIRVCKKEGILSPGLRPKSLSGDKTKSETVAKYAVKWYEKKFGKVDGILLLQPTTPFRNLNKFKEAYKLFLKKTIDVIGVSEIYKNPSNFFFFNKKVEKLKYKKSKKMFLIDGSMFLINRKTLFNSNTFVPDNFCPMINKKIKFSINVDYLHDLKLATLMHNEDF